MRTIPLTKGKFAIVDDEDYEHLSKLKWYTNNSGYAIRNRLRCERHELGFKEFMHRLIMNIPPKSDLMVDHINGDPLDNRRSNLRICTHAENMRNRRKDWNNKSGFKGVCWHAQSGKWRAEITANGKRQSLGLYESKELAHHAYCKEACALFGEFAYTGV